MLPANGRAEHAIEHRSREAGGVAGPAIERVSAVMQAESGLFTAGVHVDFATSGGIEVHMHQATFGDVSEMVELLGAEPVPFKLTVLDSEELTMAVSFWDGADAFDGGTEIVWYTSWAYVYEGGPVMTALLAGAGLTH